MPQGVRVRVSPPVLTKRANSNELALFFVDILKERGEVYAELVEVSPTATATRKADFME